MILVTHNVAEGLGVATQAAVMKDGRIVRTERREAIHAAEFARDYEQLVARDG
jgi:ABC-type proline/glycine betaine transport system ATPase subunit